MNLADSILEKWSVIFLFQYNIFIVHKSVPLAWCCFQVRSQFFSPMRCSLVKWLCTHSLLNPASVAKPGSTTVTVAVHSLSHRLLICRLRTLILSNFVMISWGEKIYTWCIVAAYFCSTIYFIHTDIHLGQINVWATKIWEFCSSSIKFVKWSN